jgi:hypothetical protein
LSAVQTHVHAAGAFVVDSIADDDDLTPGDGACAAATGDCTLRAALAEAAALAGRDRIEFAIAGTGPHRIEPQSPLPLIDDPAGLDIDGYTQPGARPNSLEHGTNAQIMIEVRGRGPAAIDGLDIRTANNSVRGLALFDFRRHVRLFGADASTNDISGNFLGTNAAATFAQPSRVTNSTGVQIERGANRNRIGRIGNEHRNLIAGNGDRGVGIFDAGSDANAVQNNVFGLTPDGGARLGNWGHGVDVNHNASGNLIGGPVEGQGNVLSGSELSGVEISHDLPGGTTTDNLIVDNLIGTTPDGSAAPLYARNREFGVNLEGAPRCADVCPAEVSGNEVRGNVIVGSSANVMIWKGAHENLVAFNTLGVLADGSVAESSTATMWAVLIQTGAFDNRIERNLIAGVARGIHVKADNDYPSACFSIDVVCPADAAFDTSGNTFSKNSIHDIDAGLGIDLYVRSFSGDWVAGPSLRSDELVNGGIEMPDIQFVSPDVLLGTACAGCTVEIFATTTPRCTDCWADHGRGRWWVADGVADAQGRVEVTFREQDDDRYVVRLGERVVMHATDAEGNTSEHSLRVTVVPGDLDPPGDTSVVRLPVGAAAAAPATASLFALLGVSSFGARRCAVSAQC